MAEGQRKADSLQADVIRLLSLPPHGAATTLRYPSYLKHGLGIKVCLVNAFLEAVARGVGFTNNRLAVTNTPLPSGAAKPGHKKGRINYPPLPCSKEKQRAYIMPFTLLRISPSSLSWFLVPSGEAQ